MNVEVQVALDKFSLRYSGKSKTATYKIWSGLFTRCYNKNHGTYKYYGAKGITVSPSWHIFENFLNDMGPRPESFQIDRIDNTKGYEHGNCRWISKNDNTKRQNNRLIDITGMKFGKWNVIDRDYTKIGINHAYFNCVCDCGTRLSIIGSFLRRKETTKCRACKDKAHCGWGKRFYNRKEKL